MNSISSCVSLRIFLHVAQLVKLKVLVSVDSARMIGSSCSSSSALSRLKTFAQPFSQQIHTSRTNFTMAVYRRFPPPSLLKSLGLLHLLLGTLGVHLLENEASSSPQKCSTNRLACTCAFQTIFLRFLVRKMTNIHQEFFLRTPSLLKNSKNKFLRFRLFSDRCSWASTCFHLPLDLTKQLHCVSWEI